MNYDEKLDDLYIDLPEPSKNTGHTLSAIRIGKMLHVTNVLPFSEGRIQYPGRVGVEVKPDNARLAARLAAIMSLAIAKRELNGSLKEIKRVVCVDGYIASGADFKEHAKVLDGASELFVQIFGVNGKHVRTAVGAASLPQNACVELSIIFELN